MRLFLNRVIHRTMEAEHAVAFEDLLLLLREKGIAFTRYTHVGDGLVSRARSISASIFLDGDLDLDIAGDCDVMISIDGDIVFKPADVVRIAEAASRENAIVGGLYMTRSFKSWPAISPFVGVPLRMEREAGLQEVRYCNTGFMAVPRTIFEALTHASDVRKVKFGLTGSFWTFYAPFVLPWQDGEAYLSEDWAACERARRAGFRVLIDPAVRLAHIGTYDYRLEDLVRPEREEAFPMELEIWGGGRSLHVARLLGRAKT